MITRKGVPRVSRRHRKVFDDVTTRFVDEPRFASSIAVAAPVVPLTEAQVVQELKRVFVRIIYVDGAFYWLDDQAGVWKALTDREIGMGAKNVLGEDATARRIREVIQHLRYDADLQIDDFRPSAGFINLQNGMLCLETLELHPHDASFFSVVQVPFRFDPKAKCPSWLKAMKEIFEDEPDKARMLQAWFAYCLIEDTFLQQFMIFIGRGANGKSVVLTILTKLVGEDNCCAVPLDKMSNDFVLVQLKDKRLNIAAEIDTARPLKSSIMKVLTGDDLLTVDKKYGVPVTFRPTAKHNFAVNEFPVFRDRSNAIRRRALFLEFKQEFKGKARDAQLAKKLEEELLGILNWALAGLPELLKRQEIFRPSSSLRLEHEFANAVNPIFPFVEQCCMLDANARIKRTFLYNDFALWHCNEISERPMSRESALRGG